MSRIDITEPDAERGPFRLFIYGPEGIGKSTFASGAPGAYFLDPTGSTEMLEEIKPEQRVRRPIDGFTWPDVFDVVDQLGRVSHSYQTLVLEEMAELERLCHVHICQREGEPDMTGKTKSSKFSFQKGYDVALEEWRKLAYRLERLRRERRMNIVFVGHEEVKNFQNPEAADYDKYVIALHKKALGLLKQWCDAIFFLREEVLVDTADDRGRGISTGRRVIHFVGGAAFEAKSRWHIESPADCKPGTIPLLRDVDKTWAPIREALGLGDVRSQIDALRPGLSKANDTKLDDALMRAGDDETKLAQLLDWARANQGAGEAA